MAAAVGTPAKDSFDPPVSEIAPKEIATSIVLIPCIVFSLIASKDDPPRRGAITRPGMGDNSQPVELANDISRAN
jgi:hypothetical protein